MNQIFRTLYLCESIIILLIYYHDLNKSFCLDQKIFNRTSHTISPVFSKSSNKGRQKLSKSPINKPVPRFDRRGKRRINKTQWPESGQFIFFLEKFHNNAIRPDSFVYRLKTKDYPHPSVHSQRG